MILVDFAGHLAAAAQHHDRLLEFPDPQQLAGFARLGRFQASFIDRQLEAWLSVIRVNGGGFVQQWDHAVRVNIGVMGWGEVG